MMAQTSVVTPDRCKGLQTVLGLTAGGAVVADDGQEVVGAGLGRAVFGQKGLQVQALQWEGDVGGDLGGEHQLVPEALQVNA